MGFSKKFKKIAKAVVNPVGAGIEKLTGMSQKDQLLAGAGIGGLAFGAKSFMGRAPGAPPGYAHSSHVGPVGVPGSNGSRSGPSLLSFFGGMLPAAIGAAGSVYSSRSMAGGQESANESNLASAREQMAFQEHMSSTSHQREVADLKAAGLNPVLSANSGASTPVGASADFDNAAADYGNVVSSAIAASAARKQFQEADSRIAMNAGSVALMDEQARAANMSAKVAAATEKRIQAETFSTLKENEFLQSHPNYIAIKKAMDLLGSGLGSARDVGILYRSLKGFGPDVSETFGPQGEHRRTTIRNRR